MTTPDHPPTAGPAQLREAARRIAASTDPTAAGDRLARQLMAQAEQLDGVESDARVIAYVEAAQLSPGALPSQPTPTDEHRRLARQAAGLEVSHA